MNVTELARKLKITKEQLFNEIEKLGFDIGRRAIKIDDRQAQKIYESLKDKVSPKKLQVAEEEVRPKEMKKGEKISLPDRVTVREFAEKLNRPVVELLALLMKNGIMASQNEEIDFETAAIITEDLGWQAVLEKEEAAIHEEIQEANLAQLLKDDPSRLKPKPPVVVVLGHVDHGKTALLDAIRESNVAASESGGITQHVGAYQVTHHGRSITFIDTPGHEAFAKMRSRGSKVADIAILVIAADDGIKPQTEEAIGIIRETKIPFLVAINKIDKREADVQKVKQQLTQKDLNPEEWGGKVICQEVSAKTKAGLSGLLDMILLLADLEKDKLLANPKREAIGSVIESHVDKGEGPVATVLVRTGTLRQGDLVTVGEVAGKIKALKNHLGQFIKEASPAQPIKIIGLKGSPKVGDILQVIADQKILKRRLKEQGIKKQQAIDKQIKMSPLKAEKKKTKIKYLNLVLKSDTLGSQEAIIGSLQKMRGAEVAIHIVRKGLGNISGQDVIQADSADAFLFGFNVLITSEAQETIRNRQYAKLKIFHVIYELIEETRKHLEELLEPEIIREELGKAEVLALFRQEKKNIILGARVSDGKILAKARYEVHRHKEILGNGTVAQIQINKKNASEVKAGSECGLKLTGFNEIVVGDRLYIYQEIKKLRKLE